MPSKNKFKTQKKTTVSKGGSLLLLISNCKTVGVLSLMLLQQRNRGEWNPPPPELPGEVELKSVCTWERVRIQLKSREWWKEQ